MLRIPRCLDNRLTDGGKFVIPLHRLRSTPREHYFYVSGTHFCQKLSKTQGLVWPEGLDKLKKKIHSPQLVSNPLPYGLQHSALTSIPQQKLAEVGTFCTWMHFK
jgi:hypothetical protein